MKYKLLIYNIRYGTGHGWKFHYPFPFIGFLKRTRNKILEISKFIKTVNPDIIGLIEVDGGSYRHYGLSQAEFIANSLGYNYNYSSKYRKGSRTSVIPLMTKQGNAFLTKQKINNSKLHYFDKGVKRLVLELELDSVVIFLVHLSLSYKIRQHQITVLSKIIDDVNKPIIVAGDFNMFRGENELKEFLEITGLQNMNIENIKTYPSNNPSKQLDFILYSPQIKVKTFKIYKGVLYSDHLPVCCEFEV
jgi:endonuclease/exonuclease/phosphatase family metal-dependent hydrolase